MGIFVFPVVGKVNYQNYSIIYIHPHKYVLQYVLYVRPQNFLNSKIYVAQYITQLLFSMPFSNL